MTNFYMVSPAVYYPGIRDMLAGLYILHVQLSFELCHCDGRHMDRLIFEGRFLVNPLGGGIIRQDDYGPYTAGLTENYMYRTADYH